MNGYEFLSQPSELTESFKVGIIGCESKAAAMRIRAVREQLPSERVVITAVSGEGAARAAREHGVPGFASYEEMIDQMVAEELLDGVIVCLPTTAQLAAVSYALDHRLNVLCEGFLGASLEEAREMSDLAFVAGRVLSSDTLFPARSTEPITRAPPGDSTGTQAGSRRARGARPVTTIGTAAWKSVGS